MNELGTRGEHFLIQMIKLMISVESFRRLYFREHHSRVVSTRHYRAPEVILGLGWEESIDIWSIGAVLFEYYTGKTMFQTHDNVEHLAMMENMLGKLPTSMIRETKMNFYTRLGVNYALNWDENTDDGVYVKTHCRPLNVSHYFIRLVKHSVQKYCLKVTNNEHVKFFNMIQSMMTYSPAKRPSADSLLKHSFFTGLLFIRLLDFIIS